MNLPVLGIVILLLPVGLPRAGDKYEWDSPLPIDKVQEMVRHLEAAPLSKTAKGLRAILLKYFDNMRPEFTVCLSQFSPLLDAKGAVRELWFHVPIASGSYLLDHPEAIHDEYAYQLAGLEGLLRAYEVAVAEKPKLRHSFLDRLLQLRWDGKLGDHVQNNMCDDEN